MGWGGADIVLQFRVSSFICLVVALPYVVRKETGTIVYLCTTFPRHVCTRPVYTCRLYL